MNIEQGLLNDFQHLSCRKYMSSFVKWDVLQKCIDFLVEAQIKYYQVIKFTFISIFLVSRWGGG